MIVRFGGIAFKGSLVFFVVFLHIIFHGFLPSLRDITCTQEDIVVDLLSPVETFLFRVLGKGRLRWRMNEKDFAIVRIGNVAFVAIHDCHHWMCQMTQWEGIKCWQCTRGHSRENHHGKEGLLSCFGCLFHLEQSSGLVGFRSGIFTLRCVAGNGIQIFFLELVKLSTRAHIPERRLTSQSSDYNCIHRFSDFFFGNSDGFLNGLNLTFHATIQSL
mmetsp:Transcript_37480/g.90883  ORF Transcript_37480/g.90883 Transcript_37480/m.90883 type:complete len:216 (-) Transcript_37480:1400-2047(-)